MRSVATNNSVSPRSKTSRTLPLRSFLISGSSTEDWVAVCMGKCSTLNAQLSTRMLFCYVERSRDIFDLRDLIRSLPIRSASGLPVYVAASRAAPFSTTLCSARSDRVIEHWSLNSFMAGIVVKPRAQILHGHDWVFSSEVLKAFGKPADGDVISLKDGRDHLIGSAIYNSRSQIVARRFSRRKQELDLDFFKRRIAQATEYRTRRGIDPKLCRVVWSESDGLPGLIVDRYGDHLVLQTLTLAMDMRKSLIVEALQSGESFQPAAAGWKLSPLSILERNDAPVRRAEGM